MGCCGESLKAARRQPGALDPWSLALGLGLWSWSLVLVSGLGLWSWSLVLVSGLGLGLGLWSWPWSWSLVLALGLVLAWVLGLSGLGLGLVLVLGPGSRACRRYCSAGSACLKSVITTPSSRRARAGAPNALAVGGGQVFADVVGLDGQLAVPPVISTASGCRRGGPLP